MITNKTNHTKDKNVYVLLKNIYGLGHSSCIKILKQFKIPNFIKTSSLNLKTKQNLKRHIELNYKTNENIKKETEKNIRILKRIGCYKGLRHRRNLPTRGQRTKTNAHTCKYFIRTGD